ncbi:hypothetical protein GGI64_001809 [Rhizobium leguminosarum]|uniref:Uncharacterized protein n=1 Tax=Rhizobium leguminosarum TaxID=384 RepID=A0A7Z0IXE9_RHILE|nr:hypothetical protein [Rhizobium leguminosarum]
MLPTEPKVGGFSAILISGIGSILKVERRATRIPALVLAIVATLDDEMPTVRVLPVTIRHRPIRAMRSKSRPPRNDALDWLTSDHGSS